MNYSFYEWLMFFKDGMTPVGTLADEISKKSKFKNFPKDSDNLTEIMEFVKNIKPNELKLHQCVENSYLMYQLETGRALYSNGMLIIK